MLIPMCPDLILRVALETHRVRARVDILKHWHAAVRDHHLIVDDSTVVRSGTMWWPE